MKAYKFRLYPTKVQEKELGKHLWISKELWNKLLESTKQRYDKEKKFFSKLELQVMVKNSGLYAQTAQGIAHRLHRSVKAKIKAKREGKKWGFPRFKSFDNMKSLYYPQSGFILKHKLKVSPFGEINIKKHREINGKIKTLTLKREPSGKWFAIFCVKVEKQQHRINNGSAVGVDLGLTNLATTSNGTVIRNPHQFEKLEESLSVAQRRLSKKQKRSNNRKKAKFKAARIHEKISNARLDFLHKAANLLLSKYSLIAMEKLASQEMATQGHGKGINDAGWGIFANILCYKAESAGCRVVFVNPKNTSKECSSCGKLVGKTLYERHHDCSFCGLSIDRDVNASINILKRATAGQAGSNACGDGTTVPSVNQEAHTF